jgi:hypothetical protein
MSVTRHSQASVTRHTNRLFEKLLALVLVTAAVVAAVVATRVGGHSVAAGTSRPAASIAANQGGSNELPPILRRATPSELAAITSSEESDAQALYYRPPANARYRSAELNVYATAGK